MAFKFPYSPDINLAQYWQIPKDLVSWCLPV